MKELNIEHANPLDISQILEIKKQAHCYFTKSRPDLYQESDILYTDVFLDGFFNHDDKYVMIAKLSDLIVAYAFVEIVHINLPMMAPRKYVYIHDIAVRESLQHHGIGNHLLSQIEIEAVEAGITKIELAVHIFSANAISFYEKNGFTTRTHRMEKQLIKNKDE